MSNLELFDNKMLETAITENFNKKYKDPEITYKIKFFDFNSNLRIARIVFEKIRRYRTIERYYQQNYVKYPVYSEWKIKTTDIKKSIKLDNLTLEYLHESPDDLIKEFCREIIYKLKNPNLVPSWFIKESISVYYLKKINVSKQTIIDINENIKRKQFNTDIANLNLRDKITQLKNKIKKLEKKNDKLNKKLEIATRKVPVYKSIFSFGICNLIHSKKRQKRLDKKIVVIKNNISTFNSLLDTTSKNIIENSKKLENYITSAKKQRTKLHDEIKYFKNEEQTRIKKIQSLTTVNLDNDKFMPLKDIVNIDYVKIIGCYVIKNTEKNKYYVGQSKDIIKRIRQHFNGTIPKNYIFAEDYYSSKINKEDIFAIKILKLSTKDELDSTERDLISYYDSLNNGYNKTQGNI